MQVKLTKIYRSTQDKYGKPFRTANGRPYERIAIQCVEYGDRWLSGFGNRTNALWKEGDMVDIDIKEVEKDGQIYLNFTTLSRLDLLEARVAELELKIKSLLPDETPKDGIRSEDMPF